jgi:hypothetical protein
MIEHRSVVTSVPGGSKQVPCPGVPQLGAGAAADLGEIVVVRLGDRQVQLLTEQGEELRRPSALSWASKALPRARANLDCPNGAGNPV